MVVDMRVFLHNIHAALANRQYQHVQFLVDYAINRTQSDACALTDGSRCDVSIGLHPGRVRDRNEDCVLVVQGRRPSQESFGLFIVCDGMGGHVHGQEAAHLALQTILEYLLPHLENDVDPPSWERLLVDGIEQANRCIYLRNQCLDQERIADGVAVSTSQMRHMGTTVTALLLLDRVAYVANVGDSRTYLYHRSLKKITQDHSLVAHLVAEGVLREEEIYTHPQRNQITRSLGIRPQVDVDIFVVPLSGDDTFLLCSDGLWEMTRDDRIEAVLATPWAHASCMTSQLVQMANDGGGTDNIGCIVVHVCPHADISSMETIPLEPVAGRSRLGHAS
ncbi:PP2C family protein-serine/threonine phosphatase [Dictyobacter aurantiacus]|uniref:PPM-type phosphatase domain-containing protein n=1 Tax=Dictyobacter aurantiacus TaxID=1936993 RepID=A0A401ZQQ9_9CHLR|nr:protein phosphatase 2C domain-containing protein [Dictyobacter aurantiacus]GCE09201.1 hypothetical protein KDAU_65300 [Dictyobacter aurantiacus]